MILGVTATRNGLTDAQRGSVGTAIVLDILPEMHADNGPLQLRHGDCVGGDTEVADLVRHICHDADIIGHPPIKTDLRAYNKATDTWLEPKTYFARNRDIVDACVLLLACPPCRPLAMQGGTSYTVDYARKKRKPVWIFWPDGSVSKESFK